MKKFTFDIYETWKVQKTFEAESFNEAWELATDFAGSFTLNLNDDESEFVENNVESRGEE